MSSLESQMRLRDKEMVPRFLVYAMFTLMLTSLIIVGWARYTDRPLQATLTPSPIVAERGLLLDGARDGSVIVYDDAGTELVRSGDDKMGFIGVIWRVMARERMLHGQPDTDPVRLVRYENGHVAVIDPVTDWSIELIGYGPDNVAAFARLID